MTTGSSCLTGSRARRVARWELSVGPLGGSRGSDVGSIVLATSKETAARNVRPLALYPTGLFRSGETAERKLAGFKRQPCR